AIHSCVHRTWRAVERGQDAGGGIDRVSIELTGAVRSARDINHVDIEVLTQWVNGYPGGKEWKGNRAVQGERSVGIYRECGKLIPRVFDPAGCVGEFSGGFKAEAAERGRHVEWAAEDRIKRPRRGIDRVNGDCAGVTRTARARHLGGHVDMGARRIHGHAGQSDIARHGAGPVSFEPWLTAIG